MSQRNPRPRPIDEPSAEEMTPEERERLGLENEGEGGRTGARNYDEATERYVREGHVDEAAKRAAEALEGPDADELREAEERARRGEKMP